MGIIGNGNLATHAIGVNNNGLTSAYQTTFTKSRNMVKAFSLKESIPQGLNTNALMLPQETGAMNIRPQENLASTLNKMAGGKNITATSDISIDNLSNEISRIVNLTSTALIQLVNNQNLLSSSASMTSSGSITVSSDVRMGAIVSIYTNGEINFAHDINMTALAHLTMTIGGETPLSPEGLARAVWSSLLTEYQDTGTFGKALADALASVGGGDPEAIAEAVISKGVLKVSDFIALK